jgi:hypothetical protein
MEAHPGIMQAFPMDMDPRRKKITLVVNLTDLGIHPADRLDYVQFLI